MNQPNIVNRTEGRALEAEALRLLRGIPGVELIRERPGSSRPDFVVRAAGKRTPVMVEVKKHANAATAWELIRQTRAHDRRPVILIATNTTAEARRILRDHGIGLIDGLGNAHVELPGMLLHIEGERRKRALTTGRPPTRLRGKAGVAAVALLLHPNRAWRVQDLAAEAGIATGLAHRVLTRLEGERVVTTEDAGRKRMRRVTDPAALLDLWTEESNERTARTTGYALAQTPQKLIRELGKRLEKAGIDHAFTGAAAASVIAPFITAVPVVDMYVTEQVAARAILAAAEVEHVADGQNVVFLQAADNAPLAFRHKSDGIWLANNFRVYADLRHDPRRGREQADHLRREVLKL